MGNDRPGICQQDTDLIQHREDICHRDICLKGSALPGSGQGSRPRPDTCHLGIGPGGHCTGHRQGTGHRQDSGRGRGHDPDRGLGRGLTQKDTYRDHRCYYHLENIKDILK